MARNELDEFFKNVTVESLEKENEPPPPPDTSLFERHIVKVRYWPYETSVLVCRGCGKTINYYDEKRRVFKKKHKSRRHGKIRGPHGRRDSGRKRVGERR